MNAEQSDFQLLEFDDPSGGLMAYSIGSGKISDDDLSPIWQRFDDAKESGSKIRIYAEMSGFPSVEASAVLDKLKRIGAIMSTTERMAIVGDAGWMEIYAKVIDPITKPDIKHFTTDQRDEALAWLRG